MIRKAVIDRFEEEYAVLLFGAGEQKIILLRTDLPEGAREGHWLQVRFSGEPEEELIQEITLDEEETGQARTRIEDKLARLRRNEHLENDPD
jgi:hypothetical protein